MLRHQPKSQGRSLVPASPATRPAISRQPENPVWSRIATASGKATPERLQRAGVGPAGVPGKGKGKVKGQDGSVYKTAADARSGTNKLGSFSEGAELDVLEDGAAGRGSLLFVYGEFTYAKGGNTSKEYVWIDASKVNVTAGPSGGAASPAPSVATPAAQDGGKTPSPAAPAADKDKVEQPTPKGPAQALAGAKFGWLPEPFLATLNKSYEERKAGKKGAEENIPTAWSKGTPANFEAALDAMGKTTVYMMAGIYGRFVRNKLDWKYVDTIRNAWITGSLGFNFNTLDLAGLKSALEASTSFCRDHIGGGYHMIVEGTTPCYRETVRDEPGLHVCVGGAIPTVHIDPTQIVLGRWPGNWCVYDPTSVPGHFKDLGWTP